TTTSANQGYIFQSIANEVSRLSISPDGTGGRVHIVSSDTIYDLDASRTLSITVADNSVSTGLSVDIGDFVALLNGSFQPRGQAFENRVSSEASSIIFDTGDESWVLKSEFGYSWGQFNMYFRSNMEVLNLGPNTWKIVISIIQIDFLSSPLDGSPIVFPIELDEWTLRLRRQPTQLFSFSFPSIDTAISIDHDIEGVPGTTIPLPGIANGDSVDLEIITIPILFGF
ncbi:MAG: hypothetical protein ACXAE3_09915, partial [Candidatus Kariarchaeaceae archaeon]